MVAFYVAARVFVVRLARSGLEEHVHPAKQADGFEPQMF